VDYESLSPLSLPAGTADGWLPGPPLQSEYRATGRGNCALTPEVTRLGRMQRLPRWTRIHLDTERSADRRRLRRRPGSGFPGGGFPGGGPGGGFLGGGGGRGHPPPRPPPARGTRAIVRGPAGGGGPGGGGGPTTLREQAMREQGGRGTARGVAGCRRTCARTWSRCRGSGGAG
jgi:hypothetical protein